jgi:hypothetical protein
MTGEAVAAGGPSGTSGTAPPGTGPPDGALPLTIEEWASLVVGWEWAETRLFEVVGGWAPTAHSPAAKLYFDACSQHHAWRARLWEERRPGLPAHLVPGPGRAGPPLHEPPVHEPPVHELAVHELAVRELAVQLAGLADDVGRLAAYCRVVLPRTVFGYRSWQERCSSVSDRAVARALGFALSDVLADWERGSALLAVHLSGEAGEEAAGVAADASRRVDEALARKGLLPDGRAGPL